MRQRDTIALWEVCLINSQETINVSNAIFHYEMVVKGEQLNGPNDLKTYRSRSKIKVCIKTFMYKGKIYDFFINPVDGISRCKQNPKIVINWKETMFMIPVLTREELNKEEQCCKHLAKLESQLEEEFIPEIISCFNRLTV